MERLLSDLAEKLQLLEGDMWDKPLSKELPARVPARRIVPAKKSIKVHLGRGLHHGHHGERDHLVSWGAPGRYFYRLRNRTIELTGPLTVRELLQAIGDAQLFECLRNEVLSIWLNRHDEDDSDDLDDESDSDDLYGHSKMLRPIDCIPLNMEYFKRFEGKEKIVHRPDGTSKTAFDPPTPICVLDPPADVDPTAGMDLQAMMELLGGYEWDASGYIVDKGSTMFLGLESVAVTGTAAAGRAEEWIAKWSEPFA